VATAAHERERCKHMYNQPNRRFSLLLTAAFLFVLPAWTRDTRRSTPVTVEPNSAFNTTARLAKLLDAIERSNAPELIGPDRWKSLVGLHYERIEAADSHVDFAAAVNALISAGGISHFRYFTTEDWTYWFLCSTFGRDGSECEVEHVGVVPERIGRRWFVRGVLEGSAAADSPILVGDELLTVEGAAFSPVAAFRGRGELPTRIELRREPGAIFEVTLTPVRESLYHAVQRAVAESIRIDEHDGWRMAYLHGWTLLGRGGEYDRLLDMQSDVDGLILDYRDGFGGTWQAASRFLLGDGNGLDGASTTPFWTKPVVILTADGTRSAKEIVVHAVKRDRRAPLIGAPTAGAVVTVGGVRRIGEDGLLLLPGQRLALEGRPTEPHFEVPRDIRYAAGRDEPMTVACVVLAEYIRLTEPKPDQRPQDDLGTP